ncbi:MAG: MBL fold metallo-hydrolase [Deltaproteobacteria bacterium]|nr:MBL fold metallo-hydrolase [Deltaproteobacteria bacterium]
MLVFEALHAFIWQSMTQNNCNTYLIDGAARILIDPGHLHLFNHVRQGLSELHLDLDDLDLVLCTHAHPAVQLFRDTPVLTTLHEQDWQLITDMLEQYGAALQVRIEDIQPDFFLQEGDLPIHGIEFEIFHTPGHSPGSISIYWPEKKALFTGDLIFKEAAGRTDLPGANKTQLKKSIQRLSTLEVEWLLTGHGDIVCGSQEVQRNFSEIERLWFTYL